MSILAISILLLLISYAAGLLGTLTGLGGGVVLVPVLVLLFNVNIHYAMGTSLIAVIATSSGAAAAFMREGFTNLRIAMFLEAAAVIGAIVGAFVAGALPARTIAIIFGAVLLLSALLAVRPSAASRAIQRPNVWALKLRLAGSFPTARGKAYYRAQRVPLGFALMSLAGLLSGLLGIGAGAFKVLAMDQAMRLPYKVSTTTSNFIIGMTATASAGVYFSKGYVTPGLTMPVTLGVFAGAMSGARILVGARSRMLRVVFSLVIFALGIEMLFEGLRGGF